MTLQFPGNTYFLEINKHQGLIANTENSFLIRRKLHRLLCDTRNARHRHRAGNSSLQTEDGPPDGMMLSVSLITETRFTVKRGFYCISLQWCVFM